MAKVLPYPKFKVLLADGNPAVGYKIHSFLAGTSTPTPTYTDQTQSTANPNPVLTNGNGEADVWLAPNISYKITVRTDTDVDIFTVDNLNVPEAGFLTTLSVTGAATFATISASGQITSTVGAGTAPFVLTSDTEVANLNAAKLKGKTWAVPDPIGATTPNTGKFSTLQVTGLATMDAGEDVTGNSTDRGNRTTEISGKWIRGTISELITLSTIGTTTNSATDLLPANSVIEGVVALVTQEILVATDWKLGDSAQAARFTAAQTGLVIGSTAVGLKHRDPTVASADLGPVQTAAAKLRITTTGTPSQGKISVTVFYSQFVPPTTGFGG